MFKDHGDGVSGFANREQVLLALRAYGWDNVTLGYAENIVSAAYQLGIDRQGRTVSIKLYWDHELYYLLKGLGTELGGFFADLPYPAEAAVLLAERRHEEISKRSFEYLLQLEAELGIRPEKRPLENEDD